MTEEQLAEHVERLRRQRSDDKDKHLTTHEICLLQNAIRAIGTDREPVNGGNRGGSLA